MLTNCSVFGFLCKNKRNVKNIHNVKVLFENVENRKRRPQRKDVPKIVFNAQNLYNVKTCLKMRIMRKLYAT